MNATATRRPARFAAVRAEGRYRVQDTASGAYVAVAASKAKAEERAAKMNDELSEVAYPVTPLLDENGHLPEFAEPMTEEEAEEVAVALLGPAVVAAVSPAAAKGATRREDGAVVLASGLVEGSPEANAAEAAEMERLERTMAGQSAPRPADKLLTVWVGWTVVDLIVPRVGDADPAVAAVARKLQDRKPDGAKARTIRVNVAEREALAALATEIEIDAVTAGSGALARSARALRGRLA